ncbi:MAG: hypothetical protein R3A46_12560 [Thermomicrobiales bacterium]
MFQLTVSVTSLDQLYTLSGHLAELGFLAEPAVEQSSPVQRSDSAPTPPEASGLHREGKDQLATDRQVNYLNDLALKAGWDLSAFEEAVTELFNLEGFSLLTRRMASDLISWLQNREFQPVFQA